jgi:hypothetical protein
MIYLTIDNGVTGSLGWLSTDGRARLDPMPVKRCRNYTKAVKHVTRVDYQKLVKLLKEYIKMAGEEKMTVVLERAMVNPGRFTATLSAIRALEATEIALEAVGLEYQFIDSKEWQAVLLPHGTKGEALKTESLKLGKALFPNLKFRKDADGILIAEYLRKRDSRTL